MLSNQPWCISPSSTLESERMLAIVIVNTLCVCVCVCVCVQLKFVCACSVFVKLLYAAWTQKHSYQSILCILSEWESGQMGGAQ